MHQVAAILDTGVLYRCALVLALAAGAGVCLFMACCARAGFGAGRSAAVALTAVALSLVLARLVYWYGRPDSFANLTQALTTPLAEGYALAGAFAGCALAALLLGGKDRRRMLDCMSVAGCAAIAIGRLSGFFTAGDRGQVLTELTSLPWSYPVLSAASEQTEHRLAVFLFQSAVAAALALWLAAAFRRRTRPGDVTVRFVLVYSASQVLLDSARYDSLYLRSNGFVSLVQLLAALALTAVLGLLAVRAGRARGWRGWRWALAALPLLAGTGYMEYYVQRHGREALFAYGVMAACLTGLVAIGLALDRLARAEFKDPRT